VNIVVTASATACGPLECQFHDPPCPPEDCGGMGGYYNFLEIMADPKHPEHEDMKEWIGGEFDAARYGLNEVISLLKRIKA